MATHGKTAPAHMKMAELERASGIGRSTLHLYLNSGLLPPPVRRGPRLHLYGNEHLERLREIRAMQGRGLSLSQVRVELEKRALAREKSNAAEKAQRASTVGATERPKPELGDDPKAATARARIVGTAARLFTQLGYERVRIADVARDAGVGKATLYEYFKSKSDLFVACLDLLLDDMTAAQSRYLVGEGGSLQTDLEPYIAAMIASYGSYRMMISALGAAAFGDDPQLAERARDAFFRMVMLFEPTLKRAMDAGHIREMDSEMLTYMAWGALVAVGARIAHGDRRYTFRQGLDLYLDFVGRGLEPRADDGAVRARR